MAKNKNKNIKTVATAAATVSKWPKLPKAFKTKWVKALRSGKYKQGPDKLLNIDHEHNGESLDPILRHCCLGVACKVAGYSDRKIDGLTTLSSGIDYRKVPIILRDKLHGDDTLVKKLTDMNDSGRWSFNRIADWINKNL